VAQLAASRRREERGSGAPEQAAPEQLEVGAARHRAARGVDGEQLRLGEGDVAHLLRVRVRLRARARVRVRVRVRLAVGVGVGVGVRVRVGGGGWGGGGGYG
jgi:hypothetical protein